MSSRLHIRHTNDYAEAVALRDAGWEPIECAFGGYGSVVGPLCMDHHGAYSHLEGVALRAWREHYGARAEDPRFVVTGSPDADAVLAIVGLSAQVPREQVPAGLVELVDRFDREPIDVDLLAEPHGLVELAFDQMNLTPDEAGFLRGVEGMVRLLREGVPPETARHVLGRERSRRERAERGVVAVFEPGGRRLDPPVAPAPRRPRVLLAHATVWGFDVWYRIAPVVVSFSPRLHKVTVGCRDTRTAQRLFGPRGLLDVWPRLGQGWGGRESIGGSPRGEPLTLHDAERAAGLVARALPASPLDE